MYRKQIFFRLSVILGILGLATLVGCDLNSSTETYSEEEVIEMMAADLASEGGEMSTLDDISNSPPTTGSFSGSLDYGDGTYVDAHRTYNLTITSPSSGDYTIEGTITGSADRPRIDSTFSSNTALTATDWYEDGTTFTVNGTVSRNGTIDYESLFRDATRATQSDVTYTYQNVVFNDESLAPTAIGGTLIAEGSFVYEADQILGTRRIEWSGTVVFEFASDGTVTAHVEDSSSSYTVNLGTENDDELVD
ncbi:MAG: hypothetical protein WBI82_06185 [Sphaerochaeta sp.]